MMSLDTIRSMSRERAEAAATKGLIPFMVETEDLEDWRATMEMGRLPSLPFPNIGDLDPAGWETVLDGDGDAVSLFVDKTGMGSLGESALTLQQFIDALEPGYGYAIVSEGQFQIYIGKFSKVGEGGSNGT